jgi:hypothetical protein
MTPASLKPGNTDGSYHDWRDFVRRIDDMLESGDYDWAEETLSGIMGTVASKQFVTYNQWVAVSNIKDARGRR